MFLIVEFDEGNEVALVPQNWLIGGNVVKWPPYKSSTRVNNAAIKKEPPSGNWSAERIKRILYRNVSFEKVRSKLRRAEEESDLQTEEENELEVNKRKRRAPNWMDDDSSDDESLHAPSRVPPAATPPPVATPPPTPPPASTPPPTAISTSTMPPPRMQLLPPVTSPQAGTSTPPMPPPRLQLPLRVSPFVANTSTSAVPDVQQSVSALRAGAPSLGPATIAQMFTILEKMREEQKEMRRMLQILVTRGPQHEEQAVQLPVGVAFPVKSTEEMQSLDDILKEQGNMLSVVRYLSMFGGSDLRETVTRLFKEVLTNDLAVKYNFKGQKGKQRFSSLQIMTVFYRCVQRNPATRSATRIDLELEVRKWLAGARDRDGGRKKRTNKRVEVPPTPNEESNSD